MNRQYKVIWSKVKHCYIVVSELVKRNGKSSSVKSKSGQKIGVTLAVLALCFGISGYSLAADLTEDQQAVYDAVIAKLQLGDGPGVTIGDNSSTKMDTSVAIGTNANATGNSPNTAVGWNATATGLGHSAAYGANAKALGQSSLALGAGATANGIAGIAVGNGAVSNTETLDESSIAIGDRAEAKSDGSIGMGIKSIASGKRSMAMGIQTQATGNYSMALGGYTSASGEYSIALGHNAVAKANSSVAIGAKSVADRGYDTYGYTVDHAAFTSDAELLTYLGKIDEYNAAVDVVIANQKDYKDKEAASKADRNNEELKIAAEEAKAKLDASQQALLKLTAAYKSYFGAASVGTDFATRQITGVAAGSEDTDAVNVAQLKALNTKVDDNKTHYFSVNSDDSTAPKDTNWNNDGAVGKNAIAIGQKAYTKGADSIAIGTGAKIFNMNTANAIAIGNGAEAAFGSIVIGENAKDYDTDPAKAGRGIFIGHDVKSYGNVNQVILGDHGEVKGQGAVAIGADTKALDEYAVAVGQFAEARAKSSSAIGSSSIAEEKGTAIGKKAKANEEGAVALGYNSKGNVEDGVSLGSYSIADREVGEIGYALGRDHSTVEKVLESVGQKARYDELTAIIEPLKDEYNALYDTYWNTPSGSAEETEAKQKLDNWNAEHPEYLPAVNEKKEIINTWQSGLGAVSVGRADFTRQITNVAAGSEDTDAVNVAQLKAVEYEGINFKGDGDAIIHRNLGTELIITGGNSDYTVLTDNNIGVVANEDTGSLTVKLSKNLNLSDGSVTFIEIAKDTDGNTLIKGENGKWYVDLTDAEYDADTQTYSKDGLKLPAVTNPVLDSVKLTSTGLNNGNQRIINVAAGTEEADAVNVSQLNALTQKVDKGAIHYVSVNGYGDKDSIDTNWKNDGAIGEGAVAIGHEAKAYGHESQAMGSSAWSIGNYSQSLGFYALAGIEPGIDQATYDALPVEEKKNYARLGMSMGGKDNTLYYRTTYKEYTMDEFMALSEEEQEALKNEKGYGYSHSRQIWARTPRSIAIGHLAKALGSTTVAIGNIAEATSTSSIAIGSMAKASGNYSFAAGDSAEAQNVGSIAIGKFAKAADYWGTAVGSYTIVEGEQGIALGVSAKAYTEKGVALGAASKAEREKGVIGYALGGDNSTFKKALESSGENVRYNKALETIASLKAEYDKLIIAYSSTDVGSAAEAEARKALDAWNAKHPEYLAAVKERDQMRNAWQSGFGAVSVGNEEATRQITNVAAGSEDSDAVNVAQLKALNNKLNNKISEEKVHYFSVNADDSESPDGTNWNNDGAAGKRAIAIGRNASTIGPGSIAIGDSAKIFNVNTQYALVIGENAESAHGSIVIGRYAKDYDTDPEQAGDGIFIGGEAKSLGGIAQVVLGNNGMVKGQGSIAIGQWAKAINYQSTAVGQDAKALGEVSSAFGAVSIAEDNYSMALGAYTNARGQSSLAVGRKNIAAGHNSIAIGNQSYAHNGYIYYLSLIHISEPTRP